MMQIMQICNAKIVNITDCFIVLTVLYIFYLIYHTLHLQIIALN